MILQCNRKAADVPNGTLRPSILLLVCCWLESSAVARKAEDDEARTRRAVENFIVLDWDGMAAGRRLLFGVVRRCV